MTRERVVISAAASGIGRAFAETYLEAGASVYVCDRDAAALDAFLAEGRSNLVGMACDVGRPEEVDRFFDRIEADGPRLDILINNAGIAGPTGPMEALSIEGWRETIEVDLNSVFYMSRRAIPMLKRGGAGSIINMSSSAGLFGFPLRSPYAAAKWAIIGVTKTLAMELGPYGIRVNAICPGSVEGPRIDRVIAADAAARGLTPAEVEREYKSQTSLRTFVAKEDIVAMAQFLTSPAGAKISGQALSVDGHTESLSVKLKD